MAVSKQPSITPETSSAEGLDEETSSRGEAKWKRFHPFRVVRKIFRRRIKREGTSVSDTSKKSWSTSELQSVQDESTGKQEVTSPLKIGLSVSHDSIFSPENNASAISNETLNVPRGSSLTVHHSSIKTMFKDELFTRVRARRDSDDEDDIGLPHSPCTSPTTVDVLTQGLSIVEKSSKSHTTCSASSLISMGSSENDEDSAGQSSGHSSRMSLLEKRSLDSDGDTDSSQPVPLNHNAAHHKIAVRPKRTYGLPRRRMNQIAATKVRTLPSTPEVTEDNGKCFLNLESFGVVKTFTEYSVSSLNEISSSKKSAEWQVSQMTTSISYNEATDLTNEIHFHKDKSDLGNCMKVQEENSESTSKSLNNEIIKESSSDNLMTEPQENKKYDFTTNENCEYNVTDKEKSICLLDSKTDLFQEHDIDTKIKENTKLDYIPDNKKQPLVEKNDSIEKQSDATIKVSSLVKSIEKSESFKDSEKLQKAKEETKITFSHSNDEEYHFNFHVKSDKFGDKLEANNETNSKGSILSEHGFSRVDTETFKHPLAVELPKNVEVKTHFSEGNISDLKSSHSVDKLDIDNEFVLKTIKKEINLDNASELPFKESTSDKESSLISSLYFEEESIMSSKSLSREIEESGIFVSHHASLKNDLSDVTVTEAHNFATVDETVGVFIQPSGDIDVDKNKSTSEPWICSVDISSSKTSETDVTVNSLTSTLCDSKMVDDKITISVNSKSDNSKSVHSLHDREDVKQISTDLPKPTIMPKLDASQRFTTKDKQTVKPANKSHSRDISANVMSMKNNNAQKRVSVEIVPFSQRMKERKYEPITFQNTDSSSDQNKKNTNTTVERKLSDRKVVVKNKESDKTNRHSFSGALISENNKGDSVIEKKNVKPEKVQYPVQIRIHKSVPKPEVKDKILTVTTNKVRKPPNKSSSNDVKFEMQSAKVHQNDIKMLKEEKCLQENSTKWEVKIHPSVSHSSHTQIKDSEDISSASSEINLVTKHESSQPRIDNKDFQIHQEEESPMVKSHENSWRIPKETTPVASDEPEPELLRVFARRSIKQKHCDKGKVDEPNENLSSDILGKDSLKIEKSSENNEISVSDNSTVIKISETQKSHVNKPDLKKKSKSFCEKEKTVTRSISPLREMNLIHRESLTKVTPDSSITNETLHPRQRLASVEVPLNLPPDTKNFQKDYSMESSPDLSKKEETSQRTNCSSVHLPTGSSNGNITVVKEHQEITNDKEPHAPSWLQLAQQRRELREQRERLLLGGSPNSFMDGSNKPSRSSKVWDMVNNFQKLQMT